MLQALIFLDLLSPDIFKGAENFGAGVICVLILNIVWIISKTYLSKTKIDNTQKIEVTDHTSGVLFKVIDELQDVNSQLVKANTELRQELITQVSQLIKENAEYKTKLDYLTNSSQYIVSTVKDIKKNGNGTEYPPNKE